METVTAETIDVELLSMLTKAALGQAEEPCTVPSLLKQLPAPFQRKRQELEDALQELVRRGELHELPEYKRQRRWWREDLETYARGCLLSEAAEPATKSELLGKIKNRTRGLTAKRLGELFAALCEEGRLVKAPSYLGATGARYSRELAPLPYLKHALDKLIERLGKAGVSQEEVLGAAAELLQQRGVPLGAWEVRSSAEPPVDDKSDSLAAAPETTALPVASAPEAPAEDAAPEEDAASDSDKRIDEMILDRMSALNSRAHQGGMVPIADLRREVELQFPQPEAFDRALWQLVSERRLAVHRHGSPNSIPEQERRLLLQDDQGSFYHQVSRRLG